MTERQTVAGLVHDGGAAAALEDLEHRPAKAVRIAVSHAEEPVAALADIRRQLDRVRPSFILLFVPTRLSPEGLAAALLAALPDAVVFGCTTAGQITPRGYEDDALVALAFERSHFRVASTLFAPISPVSIAEVVQQTERLAEQFRAASGRKRLALIFADGLSKQEDILVAALEVGLKDIPVFGGSAGDGLRFEQTQVLRNGEFHSNAALLLLLETDLAFCGLGFDHFQPTEPRRVCRRPFGLSYAAMAGSSSMT